MIHYLPIGYVYSPIVDPKGAPIQPNGAKEIRATIKIAPQWVAGLKDLADFSYIIILYHLHRAKPVKLLVKPFLDDAKHGIFAIRGPNRPNPIGFSVVRLIGIEDNVLTIGDADMIDQTPVLDIKPYVRTFDARPHAKMGWLEGKASRSEMILSDSRFAGK